MQDATAPGLQAESGGDADTVYARPLTHNGLEHDASAKPAEHLTNPSSGHSWLNGIRRPKTSPSPKRSPFLKRSHLADDVRRDSGLAASSPTASGTSSLRASIRTEETAIACRKAPSLPDIVVHDEDPAPHADATALTNEGADAQHDPERPHHDAIGAFQGITTAIPTGSFDDLTSPDTLQFSKRGSMLLGGKKANTRRASKLLGVYDAANVNASTSSVGLPRPTPRAQLRRMPSTRIVSAEDAMLSQRVRSMYEHGDERAANWATPASGFSGSSAEGITIKEEDEPECASGEHATAPIQISRNLARSASFNRRRTSAITKEPFETAGGIEDWQDVGGDEVDRYGFIMPKKLSSRASSNTPAVDFESPRLNRVTTSLQLASETPRRKRTIRRATSNARSARSAAPTGTPRRKRSQRSLKPQESLYSYQSQTSISTSQSPFRYAANRLPHNKDRRRVDEASDMLTLPPGLADIAAVEDGGKAALAMKRKEWSREDKWRKMGKLTPNSRKGSGMIFQFDTKDPKVISRTWKGIPDRWRSSAWYSFLAASAKNSETAPTEEELVDTFYVLQDEDSPDDVQIDMDVPRTINSHIMFRRRYRGGQRLLFRVLHALSLYLPDIGYVQGMAALAATLLCYYDEENAFIMMVRLWRLRGLDRLYQEGFSGLIEALDQFENEWLAGGAVAKKLVSVHTFPFLFSVYSANERNPPNPISGCGLAMWQLGITSTAYGTRWYLTLFNYSIPFPAQLRVWDVFMLLGDASNSCSPAIAETFKADLDVLHATSAALIDATKEILLDSDFENAMKVLTSWIPVKDEDLLMRVAKAEYKVRKKRGSRATVPS